MVPDTASRSPLIETIILEVELVLLFAPQKQSRSAHPEGSTQMVRRKHVSHFLKKDHLLFGGGKKKKKK